MEYVHTTSSAMGSAKPGGFELWESVGVQGQLCPMCGAQAHRSPTPSRWKRLQAWFLHGDRVSGESYECDNGHGWTGGLRQSYYDPTQVPLGVRATSLWRAVAFNRSVIPTPQSYTGAAAIGLIAGLGWNALFGWRWWLGPIGFVVAAWAAATATAFRSPNRSETVAAVHDQLRPSGASERQRMRLRRSLEELSFTPLGLVGRPEAPRLGGTSSRNGNLTGLTIAYGGPRPETATRLAVETNLDDDSAWLRKHSEEEELRHLAAGHPGAATYDPPMLSAEVEWVDCEATVDGVVSPARLGALGDYWSVAIDNALGSYVVVRGYHVAILEPVALKSVDVADCPDWLEY